jgi:glycosyltransferase involved in cell wall biosynthesis
MVGARYRIMIVLTPAFVPTAGGVQMSTSKMGRWFSSVGHEVKIFSFANAGHESPEYAEFAHAEKPGGSTLPANLANLVEAVKGFRPDVVINQMPYEHQIGETLLKGKDYLLLGCLRNTLYSVKGDLDGFINRAIPGLLRPLVRNPLGRTLLLNRHRRAHGADLQRILATYDHFVMFGPPNLEELEYFLPGYDREKIRLIPNSIPAVADSPPRKENRILWLGRLSRAQKQAELITEVWRRVCERLPGWQLEIVGDGPDRAEIERHVAESDLPRVKFNGRQIPDDYYRRAAIFFMTSAFEGFPNTLVEAQSDAAIPVVFDSYPVASWIVDDGKNGFLIKPFDVDAMADRIVYLASHPARVRIAEQALASARRFHIDRVGQMWQELFEAEVSKHVERYGTETTA